MDIFRDISYGEHDRHRFDLFVPDKLRNDRGVLLFIHGGGWNQGDKSAHNDDATYFCDKGYVTASMNYRYVDDSISVFDQLDDIVACIRAITFFCKEHGINAERVILAGGSAGANLALLCACMRKNCIALKLSAICVYCPPVNCYAPDFLLGISGEFEDWKYGILSQCCGVKLTKTDFLCEIKQEALKKMSPCEYVHEICVPVAVFAAEKDALVPISHIHSFIEQLNCRNIKNDSVFYVNSGHALDKDPDASQKARDVIESYLDMYL